nr:branched-chain-amino-acid transaminase [Arenimonas sp.]
YLRPIAFRDLGGFGLSADCPTSVSVAAWNMGPYLGAGVLEAGIDACVSSWQRMAPNTIPTGAKAGGNYLSGQLIAREARRLGFGEGIALASTGLLSEGAGENLFLVFDGALHTTPISAALLNGITRNTIMTLAKDNGIEVIERDIPREFLYLCDELFMCGTAAEITPIRSVDGRQVGTGKPGPLTLKIQDLFFGLFNGKTPDKRNWLTPL